MKEQDRQNLINLLYKQADARLTTPAMGNHPDLIIPTRKGLQPYISNERRSQTVPLQGGAYRLNDNIENKRLRELTKGGNQNVYGSEGGMIRMNERQLREYHRNNCKCGGSFKKCQCGCNNLNDDKMHTMGSGYGGVGRPDSKTMQLIVDYIKNRTNYLSFNARPWNERQGDYEKIINPSDFNSNQINISNIDHVVKPLPVQQPQNVIDASKINPASVVNPAVDVKKMNPADIHPSYINPVINPLDVAKAKEVAGKGLSGGMAPEIVDKLMRHLAPYMLKKFTSKKGAGMLRDNLNYLMSESVVGGSNSVVKQEKENVKYDKLYEYPLKKAVTVDLRPNTIPPIMSYQQQQNMYQNVSEMDDQKYINSLHGKGLVGGKQKKVKSQAKSDKGKENAKKNPWFEHVRHMAQQLGITYYQAVNDPDYKETVHNAYKAERK